MKLLTKTIQKKLHVGDKVQAIKLYQGDKAYYNVGDKGIVVGIIYGEWYKIKFDNNSERICNYNHLKSIKTNNIKYLDTAVWKRFMAMIYQKMKNFVINC